MLITWASQQAMDPAASLIARMTTPPSPARAALISALVNALITAGVWEKLDCLYVLAAADAQAARLNWKNANYTLSTVNAPTFLADRGYTGDGASSLLASAFNSSVPNALFAQDSACLGTWIGTDVAGTMNDIGLSTRSRINTRQTASTSQISPNTGGTTNVTIPAATSIGHYTWSRSAAAVTRAYKAGAQLGADIVTVSAALIANNGALLASNSSSPSAYSTRRNQAGYWGAALTSGQAASLHTALAAYMTGVGA